MEAVDRVLPPYPPDRSESARRQLEGLGVEVRTGTRVTAMDEQTVTVQTERGEEVIRARTRLWARCVRGDMGRA